MQKFCNATEVCAQLPQIISTFPKAVYQTELY